jgi:hypothetical protein
MPTFLLVSISIAVVVCGTFHYTCLAFPSVGERWLATAEDEEQARGENREYWLLQAFIFVAIVSAGSLIPFAFHIE